MRFPTRVTLAIAQSVAAAFIASFLALRVARALDMPEIAAWALAMLATVPVILWSARSVSRRLSLTLTGIDDGLRAFRDGDFSMRLAAPDVATGFSRSAPDDLSDLKHLYNTVADILRAQRNEVYQKELLLDTILQRTPVAVLLVNAADRVAYSNVAARELFADGARLDGRRFAEIVEGIAQPMAEALGGTGDTIVTVPGGDQDETFHVSQRLFRLNTQEHRLLLVERLTAELRRQEVSVWKKAIRVINHEINNTVAPISSLFHSARLAQASDDHRHKLDDIYETIDERLAFLRAFLESYAQFARLPAPRREPTPWQAILDDVRALYEFRIEGNPRTEAFVDRAQIQQVLINLVKNAHESGSDPAQIVVAIQRKPGSSIVRVSDAGRGMTEDVLRQALVPFFSTKPGGSGVGLALSNEIIEAHGGRMRLAARERGGTVVTLWVPDNAA
ncbi:MAG TPA: ATP-binding protein [Thermoanaerobaculia bacterium]|nr:ATP-binding protein [Thermoanaerobaculia bacterium]